jgi:hypothetical protein
VLFCPVLSKAAFVSCRPFSFDAKDRSIVHGTLMKNEATSSTDSLANVGRTLGSVLLGSLFYLSLYQHL